MLGVFRLFRVGVSQSSGINASSDSLPSGREVPPNPPAPKPRNRPRSLISPNQGAARAVPSSSPGVASDPLRHRDLEESDDSSEVLVVVEDSEPLSASPALPPRSVEPPHPPPARAPESDLIVYRPKSKARLHSVSSAPSRERHTDTV